MANEPNELGITSIVFMTQREVTDVVLDEVGKQIRRLLVEPDGYVYSLEPIPGGGVLVLFHDVR